ncbi:splicing factor PWI domain-containing family protein [Striga asiatica]|uniref:Splicing factor PWI domain-containing family protein n=1 Tax=Striga asiatica TaxID=4170 RepID=A0A5A7PHM3_STRAF|nr:splicing factor PWI domain-containing family protein [Striga asiatica]
MADSTPAPETAAAVAEPTTVPDKPESNARPAQPDPSSSAPPPFPYPNPSAPQPPSVLNPSQLPIQPSFRPASPAIQVPSAGATPQFSPVTFQNPGIPHPMLAMASSTTVGGVPPQVQVAAVHPGMAPPYPLPGQPMRILPQMPNGFPAIPQAVPPGAIPQGWFSFFLPYKFSTSDNHPMSLFYPLSFAFSFKWSRFIQGVVRYPSPYAPMVRPTFPPRPLIGVMPPLARPPIVGIRGPVIPHIVPRPPATVVTAEEPQTTVYVGKISSTVDNDFMLSLLKLCGPVKNWKRPQDPTGILKGFGFCEFESAEGVLRALRLLNKLSIDGQELMLNVNQTTRKYLERYVEKKTESSKKQSETEGGEKEEASASGAATNETVKPNEECLKPPSDEQKKDEDEMNKENSDATNFGLVTDEDRDADREAREKLTGMIEERLKNNPLPPPPPQRPVDGPGNSHSEQPSGSRDEESEDDVAKNNSEDKNEDDKTAESKPMSEFERTDGGSPDRSRRHDRSRDLDRERREKERELERYEREREQERAKREKDRVHRSREDERRYKAREKEWEAREREREHWRKREREREKQKAHERKWEIIDQEHDDDDGYGKKRKYKTSDEERKRRQREKEDDLADRLREDEEIEEAKIRALEEQQKKQLEVLKTEEPVNGLENAVLPNESNHEDHFNADQTVDHKLDHGASEAGEEVLQNGVSDDFVTSSNSDARQSSNLPTRKLGFGLLGSGKRTTVPSVFNEDEDEDAHKDKKMRPLVPIDYSTEEQQVIQPSIPEGPSANIAAAAEYAKRISTASAKEEKPDIEKERNRRSHDRSGHRDRDRPEVETNSTREESRNDILDRERSNKKTPENQKLLDAKQLIDTIPKTKDELFSYEINWVIYDQNALHERMRPWISKKITDYLGEEEVTLVDYIVSSTQEHVEASEMLERLQTILDDEAEMFVLKMWRMLIFEIKKVETGLAQRSKA